MVYNGYYKVMSNIPKMGHLPTPEQSLTWVAFLVLAEPVWTSKSMEFHRLHISSFSSNQNRNSCFSRTTRWRGMRSNPFPIKGKHTDTPGYHMESSLSHLEIEEKVSFLAQKSGRTNAQSHLQHEKVEPQTQDLNITSVSMQWLIVALPILFQLKNLRCLPVDHQHNL